MTSSLLAICLLCQPNPAVARDDRVLDIDQIQAGLKALTTSWTSREIHYTWSQAKALDAPLDRSRRSEGWIRQSPDGRFLWEKVSYLDDAPYVRVIDAWDGKQQTQVSFYPTMPSDGSQTPVSHLQVRGPATERFTTILDDFDLLCLGRPLVQWLDEPSAEITGRKMVDGALCIRVEVVIPPGTANVEAQQRLRIDVDPEKDFWPRRFDTTTLPASEEEFDSEHLFRDFRQVDGKWFPHETTMNWPGRNGGSVWKVHLAVRKVVLNAPISDESFLPDIPDGTRGTDYTRGQKSFTWSKQTTNAEGIPDPPIRQPWRMPSLAFGSMPLLVAIGILGCCLVVQLIRRRKTAG